MDKTTWLLLLLAIEAGKTRTHSPTYKVLLYRWQLPLFCIHTQYTLQCNALTSCFTIHCDIEGHHFIEHLNNLKLDLPEKRRKQRKHVT